MFGVKHEKETAMDLDEFVKQTLVHISRGVKESQEEVRNLGGFSNPAVYASGSAAAQGIHFGDAGNGHSVLLIDFDVAVTAVDSAEGGGKGKISVVKMFSAEAGGKVSTVNETTSRIQFKVPLALPLDEVTKQKLDADQARDDAAIRAHNAGHSEW